MAVPLAVARPEAAAVVPEAVPEGVPEVVPEVAPEVALAEAVAAREAVAAALVQDLAGATVSDPGANPREMATAVAFRGGPIRSETATA